MFGLVLVLFKGSGLKSRTKEGMETGSVCARVCMHQRHYFVTAYFKRFILLTVIV